jgi:hypothetical protein
MRSSGTGSPRFRFDHDDAVAETRHGDTEE